VGFAKTSLAPGESRELSMAIDARLLASWDTAGGGWKIAAGKYVFALGDSADALGMSAELELKAQSLKP
jgi:beta-glucosidase